MKKIKNLLLVFTLTALAFVFTFTTVHANEGDPGRPHSIIEDMAANLYEQLEKYIEILLP